MPPSAAWTTATIRRNRAAARIAPAATALPGGGWMVTIPDLPPSLNDWLHKHWTERRAETLRLAAVVAALVRPARVPPLGTAEARVRCFFPDRLRRDPTNYAHSKPLWDALVRAGVLADDDAAHLRVAAFDLLHDAERPRSEVELRPA